MEEKNNRTGMRKKMGKDTEIEVVSGAVSMQPKYQGR